MPNLAYVGQVTTIYPIPEADRIESLEVVCGPGGHWRGTAKKTEFAVGDLCEVYLQDAMLPQIERFAFLEPRGWRVRMVRLRGVPSECLIIPLTDDTQGLEPGALEQHHAMANEIWLLLDDRPEEPTVAYLDAVEEALCFGWIDSRIGASSSAVCATL